VSAAGLVQAINETRAATMAAAMTNDNVFFIGDLLGKKIWGRATGAVAPTGCEWIVGAGGPAGLIRIVGALHATPVRGYVPVRGCVGATASVARREGL
jgi:hypothetical protein